MIVPRMLVRRVFRTCVPQGTVAPEAFHILGERPIISL
jgi:hypothetical protein